MRVVMSCVDGQLRDLDPFRDNPAVMNDSSGRPMSFSRAECEDPARVNDITRILRSLPQRH